MSPEVWLVIAGLLLLAEVCSLTLVLGFFALGALAGAGAAALGASLPVELLVAALASGVSLPLVRPLLLAHVQPRSLLHTSPHEALVGTSALVTEEVTDISGQVRLPSGVLWRARPYAGGEDIPRGAEVSVAEVEGSTLQVFPRALAGLDPPPALPPAGASAPLPDSTPQEPPAPAPSPPSL